MRLAGLCGVARASLLEFGRNVGTLRVDQGRILLAKTLLRDEGRARQVLGPIDRSDLDVLQRAAMPTPLQALRQQARELANKAIAPRAMAIDRDNDFPADLWPRLGAAGLLGLTVATEYGGQGLGYTAQLTAMEELSAASAAIGLSYAAHANLCVDNLFRHATEDQRRRYLPRLCAGHWVGALAMSEPEAGSDILGSMTCSAKPRDGAWIANGVKKWITNGPEADLLIVYMRTAETGAQGLTAFLIEAGTPGFRKGAPTDKLGMRGSNTCELIFEDCSIPQTQVLGAVNGATSILKQGLDSERVVLAGGPLGIMRAALDLVLPFVRSRQQFGRPIGTFQLMQAKLADMYTALQTTRSYAYRVAAQFDAGRRSRKDAAACLLAASEAGVRVALEAVQCLGARGYMNESPAGRLLRDAKLYDIGGGTNEIRRMLIGRTLYEGGMNA